MKIRPVGAKFFHADGQTDMTKLIVTKKKFKRSRHRPGVAQRVGRGIALLFHDRGCRSG